MKKTAPQFVIILMFLFSIASCGAAEAQEAGTEKVYRTSYGRYADSPVGFNHHSLRVDFRMPATTKIDLEVFMAAVAWERHPAWPSLVNTADLQIGLSAAKELPIGKKLYVYGSAGGGLWMNEVAYLSNIFGSAFGSGGNPRHGLVIVATAGIGYRLSPSWSFQTNFHAMSYSGYGEFNTYEIALVHRK